MSLEKRSNSTRNSIKIGQYEISKEIGKGGWTIVYQARDMRSNNIVALKVLRKDIGMADYVKRLLEVEYRLARLLNHEHLVKVIDYYDNGNDAFLVMELIPGGSLSDFLSSVHIVPIELAIKIVCEIASALEYIHQNGMLHRDVKSSNILLSQNNKAYLADFGLLTAISLRGAMDSSRSGTPGYMSPEQAEGRICDGRSDVYSLAIVLFELICGHSPFRESEPEAILMAQKKLRTIRLRDFDSRMPRWLENIISKATNKDPRKRYKSASAFAHALKHKQFEFWSLWETFFEQVTSGFVTTFLGALPFAIAIFMTIAPGFWAVLNGTFVYYFITLLCLSISFGALLIGITNTRNPPKSVNRYISRSLSERNASTQIFPKLGEQFTQKTAKPVFVSDPDVKTHTALDDESDVKNHEKISRIIIIKGIQNGARLWIRGDFITLGRGEDCHLRVDSESVSRNHAELNRQNDRFWLKDLESASGTFVNDSRLDANISSVLNHGDRIKIADVELIYQELSIDRSSIHNYLSVLFSEQELKELCYALRIQYEDLEGTTKKVKCLSLIGHFERRGYLGELLEKCQRLRPNVKWFIG